MKLLERTEADRFLEPIDGCCGHVDAGLTQATAGLEMMAVATFDPLVFWIVFAHVVAGVLNENQRGEHNQLGSRGDFDLHVEFGRNICSSVN